MGDAIAEVEQDATAFPYRDRNAFALTAAPNWKDPARDQEMIRWPRDFHAAVVTVFGRRLREYPDRDEVERVPRAYGER